MNKGTLTCLKEEWSRTVVWLDEPNMAQCSFQTTQGETIVLNSIKKITMYNSGGYTIVLKDGRTFELTI